MDGADDRLIVGLDVPSRMDAERIVDELADQVSFYKIGYQLTYGGDGLGLAYDLVAEGKQVFMDLKLFDIENTVAKGVEGIARTGASFLTVHAYPKVMAAAASAAKDTGLKILGVSVLTSYNDDDLMDAGYDRDLASIVGLRAHQAESAGIGGVVCSAHEAALVKQLVKPGTAIVTPGIRLPTDDKGDQVRIVSPSEALDLGATHLVVGRPIVAAPDPSEAAARFIEDMAKSTAAIQ